MKIQPLRPLIIPAILLVLIALLASFLPLFQSVDATIIKIVQSAPKGWETAAVDIAYLGNPTPLVIVALAVAGWELYRKQPVRALVAAASLIAMPFFFIIKETVRRARPVSDYVLQHGLHDFSFPSGHATGTAAIYGMIAFLAFSHMKGKLRIAVVTICITIIVLVGVGRIYLGAHYPTDVLAGWLLAFVVLSLLRSLSLYFAERSSKPAKQAIKDTTEEPESIEN